MSDTTTTDLPTAPLADELIVNRNGSTAVQRFADLSTQLAGAGPLAEQLAAKADSGMVAATVAALSEQITTNWIQQATWTALAAITGTLAGQGAEVLDTDTGTHTDPVVGGTVSNAGRYTWSASPAGWKRIGATGLSGKADKTQFLPVKNRSQIGAESLLVSAVVGAQSALVTGSGISGSTNAFINPVSKTGVIESIRLYAGSVSSAVKIRIFEKSGTTLTQVGSDVSLTVSANALNTFDVSIPVTAGQYIGFYAVTNAIAVTLGAVAEGGLYRSVGTDATSFSTSSTWAAGSVQIAFDMRVAGATNADFEELSAAVTSIDGVLSANLDTKFHGRPDDPIVGTGASAATMVIFDPVSVSGAIKQIKIFGGSAGGTFKVRIFERSGSNWVQVGSDVSLTVSANALNTFDVSIPVTAGQHIGWYSGSNVYTYTSASGDNGGWCRAAGADVSTVPVATPSTTVRLQVQFAVEYLNVGAATLDIAKTALQHTALIVGTTDPLLIVCDGNSWMARADGRTHYPALIGSLLGSAVSGSVLNYAASGQTFADMNTDVATTVDPNAATAGVLPILLVQELINTAAAGGASTPTYTVAQVIDQLQSYCDARRAAGWKHIGVFNLPKVSTSLITQARQDALNAEIDARWRVFCDFVIDLRECAACQSASDTTYYYDGIHPTDLGHKVIAGFVRRAIVSYLMGAQTL